MEPDITSAQNPRLKEAAKLRERSRRKDTGLFLIEGVREILRALDAQVICREIFVHEACHTVPETGELLERLQRLKLRTTTVAAEAFDKLTYGERQEPIVVVAEQFPVALSEAKLPCNPLVVVVEGVEKPGNLGALLRTADAAGVSAVIATGRGTDWFNPNTIRASLGAVFTVPVYTAETSAVIAWLQSQAITMFAARVDAAVEYTTVNFQVPCAIVLGSEAEGLSSHWTSANSTGIFLPMRGRIDSLNVSVTSAILLYEAQRQRALNQQL
jgi:RNA methyltransferase, TrmH family